MWQSGEAPSRDVDLRRLVHSRLESQYRADPHTQVIDEFGLCRGQARIDVAVVNGCLSGFELKSGSDHLRRLPKQIAHYNKVFDFITVVLDPLHVDQAVGQCPSWYGIEVVERNAPKLIEVQRPAQNPEPCIRSICQLLWRNEMIDLLGARSPGRQVARRPRRDLIAMICDEFDDGTLKRLVRDRLRRRYAAIEA